MNFRQIKLCFVVWQKFEIAQSKSMNFISSYFSDSVNTKILTILGIKIFLFLKADKTHRISKVKNKNFA